MGPDPGAGSPGAPVEPAAVGPAAVELAAPAKLTLSLRVTGTGADGYHLLDAEMVNVDLEDTLSISPGDGLEVVDEGAGTVVGGEVMPAAFRMLLL